MHVVYLLYLDVVTRMAQAKKGIYGAAGKIFSVKTTDTGKTKGNKEREAEEGRQEEAREQNSSDGTKC
ncbi:hypothetical protein ACHAPT_013475 [Fusarium lateritium]